MEIKTYSLFLQYGYFKKVFALDRAFSTCPWQTLIRALIRYSATLIQISVTFLKSVFGVASFITTDEQLQ